jgi:hypothetical protein
MILYQRQLPLHGQLPVVGFVIADYVLGYDTRLSCYNKVLNINTIYLALHRQLPVAESVIADRVLRYDI